MVIVARWVLQAGRIDLGTMVEGKALRLAAG